MTFKNPSILAQFVVLLGAATTVALSSCRDASHGSAQSNVEWGNRSASKPQSNQSSESVNPQQVGPTYRGEYVNRTFGYTLVIPDRLLARGALEPLPQHGFVINLSTQDRAVLRVDGSYNAALWNSLDDVFRSVYEGKQSKEKGTIIVEKKNTLLDNQPALMVTSTYIDQDTSTKKVEKVVFSLRACSGDSPEILYTVSLTTSSSRFDQDSLVLQKVLNSWRLLKKCE